jgi:predicted enzyme related to lactoylglutathione lyase
MGEMTMFNDVAFSGYSVHDQEVAREFYEDVLGLIIDESQMGLELRFESGQSVFLYPKADHEPATFTVLNFPVDDIDDAIGLLISRGVEFERYDNLPAEQDENNILRAKTSGNGPDIAWFKDPSGNILAVLEN